MEANTVEDKKDNGKIDQETLYLLCLLYDELFKGVS
jgi:hypothetical protein